MARARILRPSKTAMQSGTALTRKWVLEYEPATKRVPDPLMGWVSARDTLNQVRLLMRIADAYGFELDRERIPEVLGVVGGGFGWRALARSALGAVPVAGWAVRGGIARGARTGCASSAARTLGTLKPKSPAPLAWRMRRASSSRRSAAPGSPRTRWTSAR